MYNSFTDTVIKNRIWDIQFFKHLVPLFLN